MSSTAHTRDARVQAEGALAQLTEKPLVLASLSYGDELLLHFGNTVPYRNARLKGSRRGEWVLGLRATPWILLGGADVLTRSHDDRESVIKSFAPLQGTVLSEASLRRSDGALTLRLGERSWFIVLTEPTVGEAERLALWELQAPDESFLIANHDASLTLESASDVAQPQFG